MTKNSEPADSAVVRSDAAERYDQTSMMFHWILGGVSTHGFTA
jgi:hypothetical protein